MAKSGPSTSTERSARARERRLARQPSLRAAGGLPRQTPECIRRHLKERGIYKPWANRSRPAAQAPSSTSKASKFHFDPEADSDTELVIVGGPSSESESDTERVIVGGSLRRSDNMPTTAKVEAKQQPGDDTPLLADRSLTQRNKINFINHCLRHRSQYLATVTNSEKVSKEKEVKFWKEMRATTTVPFQEGTYTKASEVKTIVTGTCAKRRRESIIASSRLPVIAHLADLQNAVDRWIKLWNLRDALSHMASAQALVLEILGRIEVEHQTGKRLGQADGPFNPMIIIPEVQEALGKYVESLKRPWEGTPGEAMYPAEAELRPPQVSRKVGRGDDTTDDDGSDKGDKDAIPSLEGTSPPATDPKVAAKLKRYEAAFVAQEIRNGKKANVTTGYVSPPSTSPGAFQGSNPSSGGSKHSVLMSPEHRDSSGATRLRTFAEINANAEASDSRGKACPKEPDGGPSPLKTPGSEERRSANVARMDKATDVTITSAVNPLPKPRQHRASKSEPRLLASPPEKRHTTHTSSHAGRGQDTATSELAQERTHAMQRPESRKTSTAPQPSSSPAASSGKPAHASVRANSQISNGVAAITTNNARHAPSERTTNHAIHTNTPRPPGRGLDSTHDYAKEGFAATSSSHLQPYFPRSSTPSPFRSRTQEGYWQGHTSGNSEPAHQPYWHQQRWEHKSSLANHPPRREGTARIIRAPGGDREATTVTASPRGFHTYFDENGEPSLKGFSAKPINGGSYHKRPWHPQTDGMRQPASWGSDISHRNAMSVGSGRSPIRRERSHNVWESRQGFRTATPGSIASTIASSGLFVKTPEANGNRWPSHDFLHERHISSKRPSTPLFKSEKFPDLETSRPHHPKRPEDEANLFLSEAKPGTEDTEMTKRVEYELTPAQLKLLRKERMAIKKARIRAGEKPERPCAHCQQDHWESTCPTRKAEKKAKRKERKAAKLAGARKMAPPQAPAAPRIMVGKRKANEMGGSNTSAQKGARWQSVQPAKRIKLGPGIAEQYSPAWYRGPPPVIKNSPLKSNFAMGRYQPPRQPVAAPGPSYRRSASVATEWVKGCSPETQAELLDQKYRKAKQQAQSDRGVIANLKEENAKLRRRGAADPRGRGGPS